MLQKVQPYLKFIVAILGAISTTTLVAIATGGATTETIVVAVVTAITAASVYGVSNTEGDEK